MKNYCHFALKKFEQTTKNTTEKQWLKENIKMQKGRK